jgi:hypothetical protein
VRRTRTTDNKGPLSTVVISNRMPPPKFKVAITPKPFVGLSSSPRQHEVLNLGASYFRAGSQKTFHDALKEINSHIIECLGKDAWQVGCKFRCGAQVVQSLLAPISPILLLKFTRSSAKLVQTSGAGRRYGRCGDPVN